LVDGILNNTVSGIMSGITSDKIKGWVEKSNEKDPLL
jgi:hypothetical protein